jgi:hypothetical protein
MNQTTVEFRYGSFSVSIGGSNAIIFILTTDLVKGYEALTDWLAKTVRWKIYSLSVQPVAMQSVAGHGFGITAILQTDQPAELASDYFSKTT